MLVVAIKDLKIYVGNLNLLLRKNIINFKPSIQKKILVIKWLVHFITNIQRLFYKNVYLSLKNLLRNTVLHLQFSFKLCHLLLCTSTVFFYSFYLNFADKIFLTLRTQRLKLLRTIKLYFLICLNTPNKLTMQRKFTMKKHKVQKN